MPNTAIQIERDPFGRATLYRLLIPKDEREECGWCGQPAKFKFGWERDGIYTKPEFSRSQFCSRDCWESYAS